MSDSSLAKKCISGVLPKCTCSHMYAQTDRQTDTHTRTHRDCQSWHRAAKRLRFAGPLTSVRKQGLTSRSYLFTTSFRVLCDPFTRQMASCLNPDRPTSLMPTISSPASSLSTAPALLPSSTCNAERGSVSCPPSPNEQTCPQEDRRTCR